LTVIVPSYLTAVLPTTHNDPSSFTPPIVLSISDSSPAILTASVRDTFAPEELALVAITPNMNDSPSSAMSCVSPSISSRDADVVASDATVS
jgi:hypothetical protein